MNRTNIIYTIVTIVAVILIAIGFYYKNYNKTNNIKTTEALGEMTTDVSSDLDALVEHGSNTITFNDNTASIADSLNTENFNNSMKNARTAFGSMDYNTAIKFYNQALKYKKSDTAYIGLFTVYSAQNKWKDAKNAIEKAIEVNQSNTDYRKWQIGMLNEKLGMAYDGLKSTYEKSLEEVDNKTKINLVTYFAGVAESKNQKDDAISYWKYAIELYPENKDAYQLEIKRLSALK